eukprot:gnl/TRDRNA2_/TRDRNA2_58546_c0_seq1.p1 gnl/TRDRNA2_/TRDRNA2_58546_c0~~gnl/TRDRNA2_/TRDRNA2_58546_c0_seq1.p1  ORF type:complete len:395 (-),score=59.74 gnl/TRDRNA2_/TRDRNA2_58546_c0_seq1:223-1407(-)
MDRILAGVSRFAFLLVVVVRHSGGSLTATQADKEELAKCVSSVVSQFEGALREEELDTLLTTFADKLADRLVDQTFKAWPTDRMDLEGQMLGKPRNLETPPEGETDGNEKHLRGRRLGEGKSDKDMLGGNSKTVGIAAVTASMTEASILLPINSMQARMQAGGRGLKDNMRILFQNGIMSALSQVYKALPPALAMRGTQNGLIFGTGAAIKEQCPKEWPNMVQDAASMLASSLICTSIIFPMDAVKTRVQLGSNLPRLRQLYQGFGAEVTKDAFGWVLWLLLRNGFERTMPDDMWAKHAVCGAMTSIMATSCIFPLATLKTRLQASNKRGSNILREARNLWMENGIRRFYNGYQLKVAENICKGAIFNTAFVAYSKELEKWQAESTERPSTVRT